MSGPTCPAGLCPAVTATGDITSKFIASTASSAVPGGQYIYRLAFPVSDTEVSSAVVSGRWAADDTGLDILVNGVSTGAHTDRVLEFRDFSIADGFRPGINTLDFIVHNQDCGSCTVNPVGLRVELTGGTAPSTPNVARDDVFTMLQGSTLTVGAPGLLANDTAVTIPVAAGIDVSFRTMPDQGALTNTLDGGFVYAPSPGLVGQISFTYVFTTILGDSNIATVTIHINPTPAPVISGTSPSIVIAGPTDQRVTLSGAGFQPGRVVLVGLPGGGASTLSGNQIQNATATSVDALVTFSDPGVYTLTVQNLDGGVSLPFGVTVAASPPLVFDGSQDPRFSNNSFGKLRSDSQGNLIAVNFYPGNCGGGFCQPFTVISISPDGSVNWETTEGLMPGVPYVGSDILSRWGLAVGLNDQVFVQASRQDILAYSNGVKLSGWPVTMGAELRPFDSRFSSGLTTHSITGDVFAAVSYITTFCCPNPSPASVSVVVNPTGVSRLLTTGDKAGFWFLGQGGDPYLVYNTINAGGTDNVVTRYDAMTLESVCSGTIPGSVDLGSSQGVIGTSSEPSISLMVTAAARSSRVFPHSSSAWVSRVAASLDHVRAPYRTVRRCAHRGRGDLASGRNHSHKSRGSSFSRSFWECLRARIRQT